MKKNLKTVIFGTICAVFCALGIMMKPTFADVGISLSPMNQKIILVPGKTYEGSFVVLNGATNTEDLVFSVSANPFYVDESYTPIYQNNGDYNQIVEWTTVDSNGGTLSPNEKKEIHFSIDVPKDAPAGGQYLAITVTGGNSDDESRMQGGQNINVQYAMAHIVYAEIAGTTERKGEILNVDVPSFLFSGKISGTSSIKNTGNVHSNASYVLKIFPIFSDEEVYTNEEDPESKTILPNRTLLNTTTWNETPPIGIFNVVYTAEFEGVTSEVKKLVIVCPLWLLFVIIAAFLLAVFWLFSRNKKRKKNR